MKWTDEQIRACAAMQTRALKAENEVQRLTNDMQELLAERNDLKAMLADAGVRNAVLEKRGNVLLKVLAENTENSAGICPSSFCLENDCYECWRDWLEREVQP